MSDVEKSFMTSCVAANTSRFGLGLPNERKTRTLNRLYLANKAVLEALDTRFRKYAFQEMKQLYREWSG